MFSSLYLYAQNTYPFPSNGYVGIGTTNPQGPLSIKGPSLWGTLKILPSTSDAETGITFSANTSETDYSRMCFIGVGGWNTGSNFVIGSSLYSGPSISFSTNGNVGIRATDPVTALDVAGNQTLRNGQNTVGAGASIHFTSFDAGHKGPMIRSYLDFASGDQSASRLILSSYNNGYKDELTLANGSVGIGTLNPDPAYKLSVNGSIRSKEVKVEANWSDYVFYKNYRLKKLTEVASFIAQNGHLPNIPSAAKVQKEGVNVGETQSLLLSKIEELTLYMIEKDKQISALQQQMKRQQQQINRLSNEKH